MANAFPKLHLAMWPGLVGKRSPGSPEAEEHISLDEMLKLAVQASVNGTKFDGVDLFLSAPHTGIDASDDEIKKLADHIAALNLSVGSLVAPVWPEAGGGSAMGDEAARQKFIVAVKKACRIGELLKKHGVRQYGVIRIDSADKPEPWSKDPKGNTEKIAHTFRRAGDVADDYDERLAAEGEICWAGMHSWKDMLDLLKEVGMPKRVGFQADMAHTYLYLLGYNAPELAMLKPNYSQAEFWTAYQKMTDVLRPWTIDFHVAQNDGTVLGSGSHDKTGRHCLADDPNGKLDIVKCAGYWLNGAKGRGLKHICWDGCMFSNSVLRDPQTWNTVLDVMIKVRDAHGWNE